MAAMVAATLALGACDDEDDSGGGASAAQRQVTKVRLAFTPGFGTLPVQSAREEEYFEANGLDVEFTEALDLPAWASSLDRQFDIVMTTTSVLLGAASKGVELQHQRYAGRG